MRCEELGVSSAGRLTSPSAERNRGPIADVLLQVLPKMGLVLEIGSGTGEHVVHFARAMPSLTWQPSEQDADCLRSIQGWLALEKLLNVRPAVRLEVHEARWPIEFADAILAINMLHIAPWSATQGLMRGAGAILTAGGLLCLYGPFKMLGRHTSASNRAFHAQLQATDPSWGVRDLDEVAQEARAVGLELTRTFEMPSNNLSVVFRKDRT